MSRENNIWREFDRLALRPLRSKWVEVELNNGDFLQEHAGNFDWRFSTRPGGIKRWRYVDPPTPIERALEAQADMVNHPPHYASGKVECIDALEAATADLTGLDAICTANAIKYLWRWKKKNGHEDLRKARWYINKLLGDTP